MQNVSRDAADCIVLGTRLTTSELAGISVINLAISYCFTSWTQDGSCSVSLMSTLKQKEGEGEKGFKSGILCL